MEDYNSTDILVQTFAYAQKEVASLNPERDANTIRRLSKTVAEVANRTVCTSDHASPPEIQALRSKCYFASKRQRKSNGIDRQIHAILTASTLLEFLDLYFNRTSLITVDSNG